MNKIKEGKIIIDDMIYSKDSELIIFSEDMDEWILKENSVISWDDDIATEDYFEESFDYHLIFFGVGEGRYIHCDNTIYCNDIQDYVYYDDARYCDLCNYYYFNDECNNCSDEGETENIAGYHCLDRIDKRTSKTKVAIGFEIEKNEIPFEFDYRYEYENNSLILEVDASVKNGFELVTPTLDIEKAEAFFEASNIERFTNIKNVEGAGGHINISFKDKSGNETYNMLSGWFGLFFSLYRGRLDNNYCKAKDRDEMRTTSDKKGNAISVYENRVEIRIVSAVKDYKNLLWRLKLMKIVTSEKNKTSAEVLKMIRDGRSRIHKHLKTLGWEKGNFTATIQRVKNFNECYGF